MRSIALGDPNPSRFRGNDIGATFVHVPIALEAPTRAHGRLSTRGFTLFEIIAALGILGLVCSSVLLVIDRCVNSAADSSMRMEAFRLVRENLEEILVSDSVEETVEYGTSDEYPDISWETVIEAFSEPLTGAMWVRAVCSAEYMDSRGEKQTVELVHWLTELTDQQAGQLMQQGDLEQLGVDQLLKTIQDAAEYAGVDARTLEQWVQNGLVTTKDGEFLRYNLDVFMQNNGNPTPEQKSRQVKSVQELAMRMRMEQREQDGTLGSPRGAGGKDPTTGLPYEQLEKMSVGEVMDLLRQKQK